MADPLLENPRSFAGAVAAALCGERVDTPALVGFASSDFDPFLNHVFARGHDAVAEAFEALGERPGFLWLERELDADGAALAAQAHASPILMQGMTARIGKSAAPRALAAAITDVRSDEDVAAWHSVYIEVFGADPRSLAEWQRLYRALGPSDQRSLLLLLARVDGSPAATAAMFVEQSVAGLYCFTTRTPVRGRGLATALVHAAHAAASERGIERVLLQATPAGLPVYANAGYGVERTLPVLRIPQRPADGGLDAVATLCG